MVSFRMQTEVTSVYRHIQSDFFDCVSVRVSCKDLKQKDKQIKNEKRLPDESKPRSIAVNQWQNEKESLGISRE